MIYAKNSWTDRSWWVWALAVSSLFSVRPICAMDIEISFTSAGPPYKQTPKTIVYRGQTLCRDFLGSGGRATVYAVSESEEQLSKNYRVLKVASPEIIGAENRFLHWAKRAGIPSVPRPVSIGVSSEGWALLTEAFPGGRSLQQLGTIANEKFAAAVVASVARTLDAIHRKGAVHGDIKPANILVRTDEQGRPETQLIDFDLARSRREALERIKYGETVFGTIAFIPPEDWEIKNTSFGSDLWALGITLHCILTGATPYDGLMKDVSQLVSLQSSFATLNASVLSSDGATEAYLPGHSLVVINPNEVLIRLITEIGTSNVQIDLEETFSAPLREIFRKMVSPKPQNRYQSAHEIAEALEAFVKAP